MAVHQAFFCGAGAALADGRGGKHIVLQTARFGDLVQTTRLLRTLEGKGELHLVVERGLAPLARLLFPAARVHALALYPPDGAALVEDNAGVLRELRKLGELGADAVVYNCNFSPINAAVCRCFAPERVEGYRYAPGGTARSPWMRQVFRLTERRRETSLNLVDVWGYLAGQPVPPEAVNPLPAPGGRGIGVTLAGRESRRSLPMPVLAEVVRTAFQALGGPPVFLLGSATERPAARRLLRLLPPQTARRVRDLSGRTDWPALVDAVRGLDVLLTPDTGIMHLAAHLGVPVHAFFLSSAWCHETGPYGAGHHVWQTDAPCAPCLESAPCPRETACLLPFATDGLLRSLALTLRGERGDPSLPGVRLWRSGLDALGTVFSSEGDPDAAARAALRRRLMERLQLAAPITESREAADWCARLTREADWMLPPGRYC